MQNSNYEDSITEQEKNISPMGHDVHDKYMEGNRINSIANKELDEVQEALRKKDEEEDKENMNFLREFVNGGGSDELDKVEANEAGKSMEESAGIIMVMDQE